MARSGPAATSTEPAAPAVHTSKKSATVSVGCKIPNGIVLQLCQPTKWLEETPSGTRERIRYDKVGPRRFIAGPAYPNGPVPLGFPERPPLAGGYAITTGIPADFWAAWLKQNEQSSFVVNKQVFAEETFDHAQGLGREQISVKSGFEPISQDLDARKDSRLPSPMPGMEIDPIAPADEMSQRSQAPA
jgi:hypothetical protein